LISKRNIIKKHKAQSSTQEVLKKGIYEEEEENKKRKSFKLITKGARNTVVQENKE